MAKKLIALVVGPLVLVGLVFMTASQASAGEQGTEAEETTVEGVAAVQMDAGPSLYDRLGGVYNIAAVVDDLIDRLAANDALNENPGISSARIPARFPGLKYQLTAMVCQATGGPCSYTGMSMKDSHVNMGITEKDWELFEADFKATLDKFGVPEVEQQELFAITGSTKGDIVVAE